MIASKDYRLTNEIINVYKQTFWEVSTLLQTMNVRKYVLDKNVMKLHMSNPCNV